MAKVIRLTEAQFHSLVKESVNQILKEAPFFDKAYGEKWYNPTSWKTKNTKQGMDVQKYKDVIAQLISRANAATNLVQLMEINKSAWKAGIQPYNLGPDPYGINRTQDVVNMTAKEVYLGGVHGLNTFNIVKWEDDIKYRDQEAYDTILEYYRKFIISNLKAVENQVAQKNLQSTTSPYKN